MDAKAMELTSSMPIIHFKPVDKKRPSKGLHPTPLYMYPIRQGTRERPSYMYTIFTLPTTVDKK